MFNECGGNIAECWGELAADACTLYLLVVGVAGLEKQDCCLSNNEGNVLGVNGVLLWMVNVVPADVGMLDGIAGELDVNGESGGGVLCAPACAEADDGVDQPLLWYAVEEADEVVVDGCEVNVLRCVMEVSVKLLP